MAKNLGGFCQYGKKLGVFVNVAIMWGFCQYGNRCSVFTLSIWQIMWEVFVNMAKQFGGFYQYGNACGVFNLSIWQRMWEVLLIW